MSTPADDPDIVLRSGTERMMTVDLAGELSDDAGSVHGSLTSFGGELTGVIVWIALTVAPGVTIEPRPGRTPHGFYARPVFYPSARRMVTNSGQPLAVQLARCGKDV